MMKWITVLACALITVPAFAKKNLTSEMDALGANKELMRKAKAIDPYNRVRVVQNREVDRSWRLEFAGTYGAPFGGDPYVSSNLMGGQMELHITPRFSLGGRYYHIANSHTGEYKRQASLHAENANNTLPGVDYARSLWLGTISWYPIYGKMNLFDTDIAQFDVYLLGGAGQTELASGPTTVLTAGGGIGLWLTQHWATRFEARWQGYTDRPTYTTGTDIATEQRKINQLVLMATIGFLL